ncbi:hypothetical protein ACHQM5_020707 [Ranunculus cassubicifolius]
MAVSQWTGGLDDSNFKIHGHVYYFVLIFVSLVLLFTILFLFVRWTCRYRQASITSNNTATTPAPSVDSLGLDSVIIDKLPILLHRSGSQGEEAQCSICLSAFQDQEKVKILPGCNHTYHPECVDKWLLTQSNCPLCRSSIRLDSSVS